MVCAITRWKFPLAMPAWKLAPALAFGNAVVWKPAEAASGSAALLATALTDAGLPPGILNLITGSAASIGDALIDHPAASAALVFTRDLAAALGFLRGCRPGWFTLTGETAGTEPQVSFGGMKASSSHSRERGKAALEFFTDVKTVYLEAT